MEFVDHKEVLALLKEQGVVPVAISDKLMGMQVTRGAEIVHLHLASEGSTSSPHDGATVVDVPKDKLPDAIEHIIGTLHLSQVLLFPVGKWRDVFDAVAFSLATNEDWQEFDASATVELNTRDPILCEPGDFHTLRALAHAILSDAESPSQGIIMTTAAAPVTVELVPDGAVRVCVGSRVLADEVAEVFAT